MDRKKLENSFEAMIKQYKFPEMIRQYRFAPPRRYRFDFAYPKLKIAVEIEGGSWVYGGHNRPKGFASDCEKYNLAVMNGWQLLRYTGNTMGQAVDDLKELLKESRRCNCGYARSRELWGCEYPLGIVGKSSN